MKVIVSEIVGNISYTIPVLAAVATSIYVGSLFTPSVYDSLLIINNLPYLPILRKDALFRLNAGDVMVPLCPDAAEDQSEPGPPPPPPPAGGSGGSAAAPAANGTPAGSTNPASSVSPPAVNPDGFGPDTIYPVVPRRTTFSELKRVLDAPFAPFNQLVVIVDTMENMLLLGSVHRRELSRAMSRYRDDKLRDALHADLVDLDVNGGGGGEHKHRFHLAPHLRAFGNHDKAANKKRHSPSPPPVVLTPAEPVPSTDTVTTVASLPAETSLSASPTPGPSSSLTEGGAAPASRNELTASRASLDSTSSVGRRKVHFDGPSIARDNQRREQGDAAYHRAHHERLRNMLHSLGLSKKPHDMAAADKAMDQEGMQQQVHRRTMRSWDDFVRSALQDDPDAQQHVAQLMSKLNSEAIDVYNFYDMPVNPAPFQAVRHTPLSELIHTMSMLHTQYTYVTEFGQLVGVVTKPRIVRKVREAAKKGSGAGSSSAGQQPRASLAGVSGGSTTQVASTAAVPPPTATERPATSGGNQDNTVPVSDATASASAGVNTVPARAADVSMAPAVADGGVSRTQSLDVRTPGGSKPPSRRSSASGRSSPLTPADLAIFKDIKVTDETDLIGMSSTSSLQLFRSKSAAANKKKHASVEPPRKVKGERLPSARQLSDLFKEQNTNGGTAAAAATLQPGLPRSVSADSPMADMLRRQQHSDTAAIRRSQEPIAEESSTAAEETDRPSVSGSNEQPWSDGAKAITENALHADAMEMARIGKNDEGYLDVVKKSEASDGHLISEV